MKDNHQALQDFINAQKAFFETALMPEVNAGIKDPKGHYSWETNSWRYSPTNSGFLARPILSWQYDEMSSKRLRGLFKPGEETFITLKIEQPYSEFVKAYCVSLYRGKNPSAIAVYNQQILLKRIYARMVMAGINPHPVNITSEFLQETVDMQAQSRGGSNAITNAAKDYDYANVLAKNLNYYGITLTPIQIEKKQKGVSTKTTKASKKAKKEQFAEDLDQDEHERNLSIHTFLNVVALRSMVEEDGERIVLNLVLLLMVSGFRFMEAGALRYNSFKVVEIEDKTTREQMETLSLPTIFVGIVYLGEKGTSHRTHWIEPLAVEMVDEIWVDTLVLTEKLRSQLEYVRQTGFKSYLPKAWHSRDYNLVEMSEPLVSLDDMVADIFVPLKQNPLTYGMNKTRLNIKIEKTGLGIKPHSVLDNGAQKTYCYRQNDVDLLLRYTIKNDKRIAEDFLYRQTDSKTKSIVEVPYEELLFIFPFGSGGPNRKNIIQVLPQVITGTILQSFLGYGSETKREKSIFAKYGLTDENGSITQMRSHTPRHSINTFFAIADVSEHLQAMFMNRRDLRQNEHYQHLAIAEKAASSELVTACNSKSLAKQETALERIKAEAQMGVNPKLSPANAMAQSMHTYTTMEDKASFLVDAVRNSDSEIFAEFDGLFKMMDEAEMRKEAMPHSDLHVMEIGSCMRKLCTSQCPYNLKCQDGSSCPYFTLTGREGELTKIKVLAASIESEIEVINKMKMTGQMVLDEIEEILESLNLRKEHIQYHLEQSQALEYEKVQINLLELDNMKKPKMLSTLFALEHRKKKQSMESQVNCE
ncbi:hypothetical protein [Vibrio owensii]|uniref:hypothetical protein n=1 Tax=Vibrio harveyi group TaxID=717610 RepID=UPI0022DDD0ED|nr:hypothetical protein [Vibrio owensii]MDA0382515.1 hypothetical protein [Vibrio owensii]